MGNNGCIIKFDTAGTMSVYWLYMEIIINNTCERCGAEVKEELIRNQCPKCAAQEDLDNYINNRLSSEVISKFNCTIDMEHSEVHIFRDGLRIGKAKRNKDNTDPIIIIDKCACKGLVVILSFNEIFIIEDNWNQMLEMKFEARQLKNAEVCE
jgi:hypothetical protein